jgi:hypothetical protein
MCVCVCVCVIMSIVRTSRVYLHGGKLCAKEKADQPRPLGSLEVVETHVRELTCVFLGVKTKSVGSSVLMPTALRSTL